MLGRRLAAALTKVNVAPLVAGHYRTLVDASRPGCEGPPGEAGRSGARRSTADLALMLGVPLAAGGGMAFAGFRAHGVGVLASAVTVFAVLMFSLLVLALTMMLEASSAARVTGPSAATRRRAWVAGELGANVAYAVLVAIGTAAVVVVLAMAVEPDDRGVQVLAPWATGAVTALLLHLALTLLLALKRVAMVLRGEAVVARTGVEAGPDP